MLIQIIAWYMFLFTDGANKYVISWTVKFVIYSQMIPELGFSSKNSFTKSTHVKHLVTFQMCLEIELVSKELNHLAAILHVYAGDLNFMK